MSPGFTFQLAGAGRGPYGGDRPALHLGIRPEHITVTEAGQGHASGTIDVVEYLGADTFLVLDCGEIGKLTVRVAGDTDLQPGDDAGLSFDEARLSFFDADGLAV